MTINSLELGPAPCDNASGEDAWPGTHHLQLVRKEGSSAPASPSDGVLVAAGATIVNKLDFVQRSNRQYTYRVFACADAGGCTSYYDETSARSLESIDPDADDDDHDDETTAVEQFKLVGITGESDTTHHVDNTPYINAPNAFFYPEGYTYAGGLAMYYSIDDDFGADTSEIYYLRYGGDTDDGWPTEVNDPASWTTKVMVAQGSTGSAADLHATHVWTLLTDVSATSTPDYRVFLFAQSQDATNDMIVEIESVDDVGDDFDLGCEVYPCDSEILDFGDVAVTSSGASTSPYVLHARHGRIVWDYIQYGAATTAEEPMMVFTAAVKTGVGCTPGGIADDILWADGGFVSGTWTWDVWTTGGSPDCADVAAEDAHDPAVVPLPGGEFKMYWRSSDDGQYYISYWDGSDWEAESAPVEFVWDGTGGPDDNCVNNVSAVVKLTPIAGGAKEGLFFRLLDSDMTGCGTGRDSPGDGTTADDDAIVFAQLVNG